MNTAPLLTEPFDDEEFYEELDSTLSKTAPSCLAKLQTKPESLPSSHEASYLYSFKLSCECGSEHGALKGEEVLEPTGKLKGPLFFDCPACSKSFDFFDPAIHGYHATLERFEQGAEGSSASQSSKPSQDFSCPSCSSSDFLFHFGAVFWNFDILVDAAEDFMDGKQDQIKLLERGEDFFNEAILQVTCTSCDYVTSPLVHGKI